MTQVVEVLPFSGIDRALAYGVPERLGRDLALGQLVRVPLGTQALLGVVSALESTEEVPEGKLKLIYEVVHPEPVLTPELLKLATWLQRYYACGYDAALEAMVPAAIRNGVAPKETKLLKIGLALPEQEHATLQRRAPRQAALYDFLKQQAKPLPKSQVLQRLKVSPQSCAALVQRGLVYELTETHERTAYDDELAGAEAVHSAPPNLTEEQAAAVANISESVTAAEFRVHLLHGVTGSGKTEVYLRLITQVLDSGGSALFLVPEVALTPQTVARVRERLCAAGHAVVVWHSHLSAGERFDAWQAIASGRARVVVGARSAVFAPLQNLRLLIVDEEHEPAYKQAETPRYHGRDVAVYRAHLCQATVVLGSATPSLESLYNTSRKNYRLNRLTSRVDDRALPTVFIVDMKREKPGPHGMPQLSQTLVDKLHERMEKGEQAILFLNRRGFSPSLLCGDCGHVPQCPHCAVTLTYHRAGDQLKCHLCGYQQPAPKRCPACGSKDLKRRGSGTQRIEDAVRRLLPRARVFRLDADTMGKKNLFRKILGDFRTGKIDILVGTQMIAKGLDFPNVTLVGMVDADISLHVPDFRAGERAFQLLVQVSGRAGRGDRAGEVVVQTYLPHSSPIQFARRGDFDGFLEAELEERREFHYPPFRNLVRHIFRGRNPEKVAFFAEQWAKKLQTALPHPIEIRGPTPCPLEKIKDHYRFHCFYFMGAVSKIVPEIVRLRREFPMDDEVQDVLDVDAMDVV